MKASIKVLAVGGAALAVCLVLVILFPEHQRGIIWACAYAAGVYSGSKWSYWS